MTEDHIVSAIRRALPANAEIQINPGPGSFTVAVAWKLNNDAERPNKMSKTIAIRVSHEAVEDFKAASAAKQTEACERVSAFIAGKISGFDPSHNTPRFEPPPVAHWLITSSVLLG